MIAEVLSCRVVCEGSLEVAVYNERRLRHLAGLDRSRTT